MKRVLRMEWQRLIHSKLLWVGILIETIVAGMQIVTEILPWLYVNEQYLYLYPLTSYEKWIGSDWSSWYSLLYVVIAPILMSLPYGGTLMSDIRSGYIKNVVTRANKRDYLLAKYMVSCCVGLLIMIPFMLNFVVVALLLPSVLPQSGVGFFSVLESYMWAELFYAHPLIYTTLWMLMDVVVLGLFASTSIAITWLTKDYFVSLLTPFILSMVLFGVNLLTNFSALAPQVYLRPSQPDGANMWVVIVECMLILIFDIVTYQIGKKREVL